MHNPRHGYLENEVLSASPAKLHLLLIEGALRVAEQARQHWRDGNNEQAFEALVRAQEIVTEMTAGLNREAAPEITGRLSAVYLFIFRALVEAGLRHSEAKLDEALRVLAIERDTWRAVCAKLKSEADSTPESTTSGTPLPPHFAAPQFDGEQTGFSLEA
jgi:flagellar protein FliS